MNCPNCGSVYSPDQNFCRSCGMNLEMTSDMLAGRRSRPALRPASSGAFLIEAVTQEIDRRRQRRLPAALVVVIVMAFLVFLRSGAVESPFPLSIMGVVAIVAVVLLKSRDSCGLPARNDAGRTTTPFRAQTTPNRIGSGTYESAPSVTEQTTRALEPISSRRDNLQRAAHSGLKS